MPNWVVLQMTSKRHTTIPNCASRALVFSTSSFKFIPPTTTGPLGAVADEEDEEEVEGGEGCCCEDVAVAIGELGCCCCCS